MACTIGGSSFGLAARRTIGADAWAAAGLNRDCRDGCPGRHEMKLAAVAMAKDNGFDLRDIIDRRDLLWSSSLESSSDVAPSCH